MLAGEPVRFCGKCLGMRSQQMSAVLRIGGVSPDSLKAQQRLNGHRAVRAADKSVIVRQQCLWWRPLVDRQAIRPEPQQSRLIRHNSVPVKLPAAVPPDSCFHADMVLAEAVAQTINRTTVLFCDSEWQALVAAHDGAVAEFRRERGVQRVMVLVASDLKTEPGAV